MVGVDRLRAVGDQVEAAHVAFLQEALQIPEIAERKRIAEEVLASLHYEPSPQLKCSGKWKGNAMVVTLYFSIPLVQDQLIHETLRRITSEVETAFRVRGLSVYGGDTLGVWSEDPWRGSSVGFTVLSGQVLKEGIFFKEFPFGEDPAQASA